MEGLRGPSAANKWLLAVGGRAGMTDPAGTRGDGGARCGASRVLHFRAPSGTHHGGFSQVLLWRRAMAGAPAFPRRPSHFSAFISSEKLEEANTEETSPVQTHTASELPVEAAESETAQVQNQTAETGSLPMATGKTEHSAEAVQSQTATESLEAGAETETTQVHTHASDESQQSAEVETVQVETRQNDQRTIRVRFMLQKSCQFGEHFLLAGEDPILGSWDTAKAIPLEWSDGHVWIADLDLPVGEEIKYKFILQTLSGKIKWQPGVDRVLQTWEGTDTIVVAGVWETAVDQKTTEKGNISEDSTSTGTEGGAGTENNLAEVADGNLKNIVGTGEEKPVVQKGDSVLIPGLASLAASSTEA